MSAKSAKKPNSTAQNHDQEVEVLYQKLGDQWYAFSMIDDEAFMSPVTEDQIEEVRRERNNEAA